VQPNDSAGIGSIVRGSLLIFAALFGACSRGGASPSELRPAAAEATRPEPAATPSAQPIALVELFTSQGCSSCPPADDNARAIADRARSEGRRVYVLSFHVDYWNDLGWTDPFSDAAHSTRQRRYASTLGGGRVYTPQLVVNGREELLGSDREGASAAVERALDERPALGVAASLKRRGERELLVAWELSSAPQDASLNFALVQGARDVSVTRGENRGRTLSHANVVRVFETEPIAAPRGKRAVSMPEGVRPDAASVVVFAQSRQTLRVLGATSLAVR
jgi:hypothetical protein